MAENTPSWFSGAPPEDAPNRKSSNTWFRGSAEKKKGWFSGKGLQKGMLRSEAEEIRRTADVSNDSEDGAPDPMLHVSSVTLQRDQTNKNRAALQMALPDNVGSDQIFDTLLDNSPLRQVDLTVEDSFRLAEQFIRDGRVGRCIRVHLQDQETRKVELIADSDAIKMLQQAIGLFSMMYHMCETSDEEAVHFVALGGSLVFTTVTLIKLWAFGRYYFKGKPWQKAEVTLVFAHLLIVSINFIQSRMGTSINPGWYELMLPIIMIAWSRTMRHTLQVVVGTFRASATAIFSMLFVLLIFGYYGVIFFEFDFQDAYDGGVKQDRYDNLYYAFVASFCLLTTENYPSIQVTAWQHHKMSLLYFMPFVFLTLTIQAFVLGRVDAAFTRALTYSARWHFSKELRGYAFAFLAITLPEQTQRDQQTLYRSRANSDSPRSGDDDDDASVDVLGTKDRQEPEPDVVPEPSVTPEQWLQLVRFFAGSEQKAKAFADVTFYFRDEDASGDISLLEFMSLAELLKFEITEEVNLFKTKSRSRPGWGIFRGWSETPAFASFSALNIIVTAIVLMHPTMSSHADANDDDFRLCDSSLNWMASILIFFFVCEVILRILSRGMRHQFSPYHVFDFFETCILIVTLTLMSLYGWRGASILVMRCFCLLRWALWQQNSVLWRFDCCFVALFGSSIQENIHGVMKQVKNNWERTSSLFLYTGGLLLLVQYFFAVLATMMIDNKLEAVNQNEQAPMNGAYGDLTNFATVGSSMIAMFQVMLTNNWNDILYTAVAATHGSIALFFIIYYILVPLLFLNIFTSIILQSFKTQADTETQAPSAIVVEYKDLLYRLERKGYRRGLELHMDLIESTKQELMGDIIREGVFETSVLSGVEEELMNERKAFAVLQLRHQKQKEQEKHEQDFAHSAFAETMRSTAKGDEFAQTFQPRSSRQPVSRSQSDTGRTRSDTVARHRGVRTKFGHQENMFNRSCPTDIGKETPRARSATLGTPLDEMQMYGLRLAREEEWASTRVIDEDQLADIDRVFAGSGRVHKSLLQRNVEPIDHQNPLVRTVSFKQKSEDEKLPESLPSVETFAVEL